MKPLSNVRSTCRRAGTAPENEAGNVLVIMTVGFVVFLLIAGLVVDFGIRFVARQQLQTLCDASALAGAQDLTDAAKGTQSAALFYAKNTAPTNPPPQTAGSCPIGSDSHMSCYSINGDSVTITTPYTRVGDTTPANQLIHVTAHRVCTLYFARMIGITSINVGAAATAKRTLSFRGILVLNPTVSAALKLDGGATINVSNGNVVVNSSDSDALDLTGGSTSLTATRVVVVGGYGTSGGASISPTPQTSQPVTPDPYASLPAPSPTGMTTYPGGSVDPSQPLNPGIYTSQLNIPAGSVVTFNPGIYILQGGINLSGQATIIGNGVMLYNQGQINLSGTSTLILSPPTSGPYAGITMFQDRANTTQVTLSGGSSSVLAGTYYFPSAAMLELSGGSGIALGSIITWQMHLSGGSLEVGSPSSSGGSAVSLLD